LARAAQSAARARLVRRRGAHDRIDLGEIEREHRGSVQAAGKPCSRVRDHLRRRIRGVSHDRAFRGDAHRAQHAPHDRRCACGEEVLRDERRRSVSRFDVLGGARRH
jgi:hypothetical protein